MPGLHKIHVMLWRQKTLAYILWSSTTASVSFGADFDFLVGESNVADFAVDFPTAIATMSKRDSLQWCSIMRCRQWNMLLIHHNAITFSFPISWAILLARTLSNFVPAGVVERGLGGLVNSTFLFAATGCSSSSSISVRSAVVLFAQETCFPRDVFAVVTLSTLLFPLAHSLFAALIC